MAAILLGTEENEGTRIKKKAAFDPIRKPIPRFAEMTLEERVEAIREDPNYGQIFCRCENVTKAEVLAALHNPLGVHTVTGIKNRTRSMMGRCQGGYCQTRITELIEKELGLSPEDVGLFVRDAETVGTSVNFLIREGILVARAAPEIKLHEAAEGGNVEAIKQLEAVRKRHTFERLIEQMDDDEFN